MAKAGSTEKVVREIQRHTRRRFSAEEKIRIVAGGAPRGREHRGALRRCCMNRHWPARCPPTEFLPADTIRRWSAKGGHPIQDLTAEDDLTPLPGWAPGREDHLR